MSVLAFLLHNLDHFRRRFVLTFSAALLEGFVSFLIPVLLAQFTRGALTFARFRQLTMLILLCYAGSLLFQWIVRRWGEAVAGKYGFYLRLKYFRALQGLSVQKLTKHHSGYILSLINNVARNADRVFQSLHWTYATSVGTIVLFFVFTARESFGIAVFNLAILIAFTVFSIFLSRKMVGISTELNKKESSLLSSFADFMANILTIRKLSIAPFAERRLTKQTDEVNKQITILQEFHSFRWFLLHSLYGAAFLSTIAFMLWRVTQGQLSASVLILFIAAYASIRGTIERMSENMRLLMEMRAYVTTLNEIVPLDAATTVQGTAPDWKEIVFRDIAFRYPETNKTISIPSFHFCRGEKICIRGVSGEGKTTLLSLLTNFYKPDSGSRELDGTAYTELAPAFFAQRVVFVSQEVELFNMSLYDNITLGIDVPIKRLDELLAELDLLAWSRHLGQGLNTIVGEKGIRLSAGQKQRINLLRGVLLDRDIYLLDEPTSHLDAQTEQKMIAFLSKHLSNKTVIIVSHREPLRALCSREYVMEEHTLREVRSV